MSDTSPFARPVPLEQTRQRVIEQLCEHYAVENLTDQGLEERLAKAYQAETPAALQELLVDLPVLHQPGAAVAPAAATDVARADYVPERQVVVAIMGGAERKGVWTPPRQLAVVCVMGGAALDFRDARFGPGVTEVTCFALMGGVEITVPPGVHVELNGLAIMGGFGTTGRVAQEAADASAPILRIGGFAMMGGVEVDVRYPGERPGDARRREKLERKEAKRLSGG